MNTSELRQRFDPWREIPRKSIVVILCSVFVFFTTIGFANDIMSMGREQPMRYALGVIIPALFAVAYAIAGFVLRNNWWKAILPLFCVEFVLMGFVANRFPDRPSPVSMSAAELGHMRVRLTVDSIATMTAVSLGYIGFFVTLVTEAKRYVKTRTEKALLESEMAAARQVQEVILPEASHSIPGYAVESVYKPAREVGGDFFQIVPVGNGGMIFVIGDVSGKGLPAAMLVSLVVGSIRAIAEETHDPAILLHRLDRQIAGRTNGGFATALAACFGDDGMVTLANAGHVSPYQDGREVLSPGALPLGISDGGRYETTKLELPVGSRLTFLSDGVVEARKADGELFGFERAKAISREPAAAIVEAAVEFGQDDDITVVTIERQVDGALRA